MHPACTTASRTPQRCQQFRLHTRASPLHTLMQAEANARERRSWRCAARTWRTDTHLETMASTPRKITQRRDSDALCAVRCFQLKERTLADFENQPQVGLARSEIGKESLMHNIMHAHDLRSCKGCAWPCLEAPAFREQNSIDDTVDRRSGAPADSGKRWPHS